MSKTGKKPTKTFMYNAKLTNHSFRFEEHGLVVVADDECAEVKVMDYYALMFGEEPTVDVTILPRIE